MKPCSRCAEVKPLDQFYVRAGKPYSQCKACHRLVTEAYRARHKDRLHKRIVERRRAERLGMTLDEYLGLDADPGTHCTACGCTPDDPRNGRFRNDRDKPAKTKRLAIDHDHVTGRLRGFLCSSCNRAIGYAGDDPVLLRKMADYLESGTVLAVPLAPGPRRNQPAEPIVCSAEGCPKLAVVKGLCTNHYERQRRTGSTADRTPRLCSIEGCDRKHYGHDLCRPHLRALHRTQ